MTDKLHYSDPRFVMGQGSWCYVDIVVGGEGNGRGYLIVILSEPDEPSGTSVTNACEHICEKLFNNHLQNTDREIVWVEHYRDNKIRHATYDLITFQYAFHRPSWRRIKLEDWVEWGMPVPSDFIDEREMKEDKLR